MFRLFVFDGILCDEYGVRCVNFNPAGKETYESQKTNLKVEKSAKSNVFHIISQEYSDPLVYKIQIANRDFSPISSVQERVLNKWLCKRGKYSYFCVLDKRFADTWFYANISNPVSIYINDVNGLEYTVTTNSPFAYSDQRDVTVAFDENDTFEKYIDNDEDMPIYPDMVITVGSPGTLTLTNQSSSGEKDNVFTVKNCSAGEIITVHGNYPAIFSSAQSHNVYNDFNKNWFYWIDGLNTVHSNIPCTVNFKYREFRKMCLV